MSTVIYLAHVRASAASAITGRGTPAGQSAASGQLSENQRKAFSRRPTLMSEPHSSALIFFPSLNTRELTVERGFPSNSAYARATRSSWSMPDMGGISVSIPVLSTAMLPGARLIGSGHSTGMDLTTIITNIDRRLKVLGISSDEASRRAGRPDAIRNLRRKIKAKTRGSLRADTLAALAAALETTVAELGRPDQPPPSAPISGLRQYLLEQRALIDRQLAELDAAEFTAPQATKKKNR